MRRTQLYLEEDQYRWLRREAGAKGSIAGVVRELIERARREPPAWEKDPLIKLLLYDPPVDGKPGDASTIDRDVYGG
ncbi:MAG: hypothetical protein WEB06_08850 [Actinomycetota bacterium]